MRARRSRYGGLLLGASTQRSSSRSLFKPILMRSRLFASSSPEIEAARERRKKIERAQILEEVCSRGNVPTFPEILLKHNCVAADPTGAPGPLKRLATQTLQVNVGKLCNQTCHHCHVEAGPTRTKENMDSHTVDRILDLLRMSKTIHTVDITGGAPELNKNFKRLVTEARMLGKTVMDRCNLTVLFEPHVEDLPTFLSENSVQVVASLPCYTITNVDKQRGKGVFDKSISALKLLNKLGYGDPQSGLQLHLVYNPVGPSLPGAQPKLEADYKRELKTNLDIVFNSLFTITNMPIKRFADSLFDSGQYEKYMGLLVNHFNSSTVDHLMCRDLVSISWDGKLYDCDFNQMLEIDIGAAEKFKRDKTHNHNNLTVWDIQSFDDLEGHGIATDRHCFGCTAGAGSSCGGSLL